jgi:hypothetical protein
MKKILTLTLLLTAFITVSKADEIDDIFNTGNGEFKFERFSNEGILLAIDKDAKVACQANGQCVLSSVTSDSNGWEVSFNIGHGNSVNPGSGTTIITGGGYGNSNCITCNDINWGINVSYKVGHCTQTVMVPRSLYYAINRYMYGLLQESGETKKGFTPADEAIIMFYTTISKQATGCTVSK